MGYSRYKTCGRSCPRHSWEVHQFTVEVGQTEIKGFYPKGFLRSKELAGTVGVDPVLLDFGFYLPFSD